MKVKGVSVAECRAIAADLGFRPENERREGRYWCFVLRMATPIGRAGWRRASPEALRYRKRSYHATVYGKGDGAFGGSGAVCFHGHRKFMRRLFEVNPEAVVRTKLAAYLGTEDFEEKWPAVGQRNVGSVAYPISYDESCDC